MAPLTSALPTSSSASFIINKKVFSPRAVEAVQKITHGQSHTSTLTTMATEEAATHIGEVEPSMAPTDTKGQAEEESYDGDDIQ